LTNQTFYTVNKRIIYFDTLFVLVEGVKKIMLKNFADVDISTFTKYQDFTQAVFSCLNKGEKIDLIITNYTYPDLNCYELTKTIREYEQHYNTHTPILLFTMYEQIPEILQGLKEKVFDKYISLNEEEGILIDYIKSALY